MKNYKLYDVYEEERNLIGEFGTLQEVAKACTEYAQETDDECIFLLVKLDVTINKYRIIKDWTYNKITVTIKGGNKNV